MPFEAYEHPPQKPIFLKIEFLKYIYLWLSKNSFGASNVFKNWLTLLFSFTQKLMKIDHLTYKRKIKSLKNDAIIGHKEKMKGKKGEKVFDEKEIRNKKTWRFFLIHYIQ